MSGYHLARSLNNRNLSETNREVLTWPEQASITIDKKRI